MNKLQFHNKKNNLISDAEPAFGWKILVVDDDPEVHQVTQLVLNRFQFQNKTIQILQANSAEEAKQYFKNERNIAVAFVDVIMETDRAGLDLVDFVRNNLHNQDVRIIIRTGQPGIIQEQTTIDNYDIDDFKEKTELTNKKLISTLTLAIKHYETHQQLTMAKDLAERANESKSLFLANMSHELRTPMHAILSYSVLGMKKTKNTLSEINALENTVSDNKKLSMYFERINSSGERLLALLNNLLDLSKLEARASKVNLEFFCFYEVIQEMVQEQEVIIKEKDIILNYHIDVANTRICSDKGRVQQIIYNFLSNAIKFSPEGGTITIGLKDNTIDEKRAQIKAVQLSIADEGPGIPEQELGLIFDKFVQSSKTATGAGGTGLGLSISNEIAKLLEGRVWAENKLDTGAVFNVLLPLNDCSSKSRPHEGK